MRKKSKLSKWYRENNWDWKCEHKFQQCPIILAAPDETLNGHLQLVTD